MILHGDVRDILPAIGPLPASIAPESVDCVVTSPPYFGLRDYGVGGQIGLEPIPDCLGWATGEPCGRCFVLTLVQVFRGVWRALKPTGVCWVNLGDSIAERRIKGVQPGLPLAFTGT